MSLVDAGQNHVLHKMESKPNLQSGVFGDDLKSSPCLERNYKVLVYLLTLHSATVISSIFNLPFHLWKSEWLTGSNYNT